MKKIIAISCMAAMTWTACTNETDLDGQEQSIPLSGHLLTGWNSSRAIIEDSSLNNLNGGVGITLGNEDATSIGSYFGKEGLSNQWVSIYSSSSFSTSIGLYKGHPTWVYAYYPYQGGADLKALPIQSSEADKGTDYLWGKSSSEVDGANPKANITMKHALAAVRVVLKREGYRGVGLVTDFTVSGTSMARSASLNTLTGEIHGHSIEDASFIKERFYMDTNTHSYQEQYLVIPRTVNGDLRISMSIDGNLREVTVPDVQFTPGKRHIYNVTLNEDKNTVTSVGAVDWDYEEGNPTAIINNRKVTVKCGPGIAVNMYVANRILKVTAIGHENGGTPITYTVEQGDPATVTATYFAWGDVPESGQEITVTKPLNTTVISITKK